MPRASLLPVVLVLVVVDAAVSAVSSLLLLLVLISEESDMFCRSYESKSSSVPSYCDRL